jgi:hypothetical protein
MEVELLQLAREAVAALQAGPAPNWVEITALGIGFGQLLVIIGGLWMMNKASNVRNRQLDLMETAQREQAERLGTALERQGEVLAELLRRSNPT